MVVVLALGVATTAVLAARWAPMAPVANVPAAAPSLSPDTQEYVVQSEKASLPAAAEQVDCAPGLRMLPPQTRLSRAPGSNLGFFTLSDGSCWQVPTTTPPPLRLDSVDATKP